MGKGRCPMIPETVAYYHAMLLVGIRDKLDEAFDHALEKEDPLSDLMLSLSTCISDDEAVLSVLQEYILDHTIDDQVVYHMIRGDFRQRRLSGQMTRAEVTEYLYGIVRSLDKFFADPWYDLTIPNYVFELWRDGFLAEEVFDQYFDAWLLRGENLNPWKLQEQLNNQ